jgi:ATP phosphoribosyltransferase regulatory subunit
LPSFQISVGHIGFVQTLFQQILGTEERAQALTKFLYEKNYVGYREHVKKLSLSSIDKQRLLDFLKLRGGEEVLSFANDIIENESGREALSQLQQLWEIMVAFGEEDKMKFDLTLISHMSYYTGIVFEVYSHAVGTPIGNGGRYDLLLEKFGKATGATGFALYLDRLIEALGGLSEEAPATCILFSDERRQEAYELAKEKRATGEKVVLQDINGVKNIDACTSQYSDIVFLIGKAGRGS